MRRWSFVKWSVVLLLCLCAAPSAARTTPRHAQFPPQKINDVYVVLLVLDGCRSDMLYDMVDRGELPAVKKYLVDRGTQFSHAITVFPSATVNAYQSMVTGLFPGHAGIPYAEWFDRRHKKIINFFSLKGSHRFNALFHNYYYSLNDGTAPTYPRESIFDDLAGYPTAAMYTPFSRHATLRTPKIPLALLWAEYGRRRPERVDVYNYHHILHLFRRPPDQIPRMTFAGLLSTDYLEHHLGVEHVRVRRTLRQFDTFVEKFVQLLTQRHLLEKTYIIVTSDHGMHDIKDLFHLRELLRTAGLQPIRDTPRSTSNVFVGARGISVATLTMKSPHGWQQPIAYDTLRAYPIAPASTAA